MNGKEAARVVALKIENFARIKAVSIEVADGGGLVEITGRNDEGKSTILAAIKALVGGKGAAPAQAIRRGQERAELFGDLGPVRVWRTIRKDKRGDETWDIKVTAADGTALRTPQAVLDAFRAEVGLDPLAFMRLKPREQYDVLKGLVADFDFDANAAERKRVFDARTDVNREADREQAVADSITPTLPPRKPAPVDVAAKIAELRKAGEHNASVASAAAERGRRTHQAEVWLDEAEQLRAQAATLEKRANEEVTFLSGLPDLEPPVDVAALETEIAAADTTAKILAKFKARDDAQTLAGHHRSRSEEMTKKITALDSAKAKAIADASLPVDGLALGDGEVLLNDLPLAQAALSRKIETCTAIAMALNPRFRVVMIDEGSELDSEMREVVRAMAVKRGFDVWLTRVDESGEVGFVVVDGELVEPAARPARRKS